MHSLTQYLANLNVNSFFQPEFWLLCNMTVLIVHGGHVTTTIMILVFMSHHDGCLIMVRIIILLC